MFQAFRSILLALVFTGLSAAVLVLYLVRRWTKSPVLGSFIVLLGAATGIVVSMVMPRSLLIGGVPAAAVLDVGSNVLFLAALPRFVFRAADRVPPRWFAPCYGAALAAAAACSAAIAFGAPLHPGVFLAVALAMTAALAAFLWNGLHRIGDHHQLRLIRRFLVATGVLAPLVVLDSVGGHQGWEWIGPLHRLPGELYLVVISGAIIRESGSWLLSVAERKLRDAEEPDEAAGRKAPPTDGGATNGGGYDIAFLDLSPRQREIAALIVKGYSAKEIAVELDISPKTAENHTYNLYRKLGARSRIQFYDRARRAGFLKGGA